MLILMVIITTIVCLVFLQYYRQRWPVANFPPGPFGFPLIGSVLDIGYCKTPIYIYLWNLAKKYGDVYSFPMGSSNPIVILNGYVAIREAILTKSLDFASRKEGTYTVQMTNPNRIGILNASHTSQWQKQRHFAHTTLRGFGFGKSTFEGKIKEEAMTLLDVLKETKGNRRDLSNTFSICTSNIMCDITFGVNFNHSDFKFQRLLHLLTELLKASGGMENILLNGVPLTRPFLRKALKHMLYCKDEVVTFISNIVSEHIATYQAGGNPRDFIDCYLAKMEEDPSVFSLEELNETLLDLFAAGTETTATTLSWGILYMMINTDIQKQVHQELMKVVGTSRLPCLSDREHLPYTTAVIREIQRIACIVPIVPRCTTTDTSVCGYTIPKGTNIMYSAWSVDHSPELWTDPEAFDPKRHLNAEGKLDRKQLLMSFGLGRRVCMGESLAKMELFLLFSCLMHRFKFEIPAGADTPSTVGDLGLTLTPKPYEVVFYEYT